MYSWTRAQAHARVVYGLVGAEEDSAAYRDVQHARAETSEQSARIWETACESDHVKAASSTSMKSVIAALPDKLQAFNMVIINKFSHLIK